MGTMSTTQRAGARPLGERNERPRSSIPRRPRVAALAAAVGGAALLALGSTPAAAELVAGWDFSDLAGDGTPIPAGYAATHVGPGATGSLTVTTGGATAIALPPAQPGGETDLACGRTGLAGENDPTFPPGVPTFGGPAFLAMTAPTTNGMRIELEADSGNPFPRTWRLTAGAMVLATPSPPPGGVGFVGISFGDTCASATSRGLFPVGLSETAIDVRLGSIQSGAGCAVIEVEPGEPEVVLDNLSLNLRAVYSDSDADLVPDAQDNCVTTANGPGQGSNQIDTDLDGYGNACDADYDQDELHDVNVRDFARFLPPFMDASPAGVTDHNGDCDTTVTDFSVFLTQFQDTTFPKIGPSGLACAGNANVPCRPDPRMEACVSQTCDDE